MLTGDSKLLFPDDTAKLILAAMDKADVRLIKLGYFMFDPLKQNYWQEVDRIRCNRIGSNLNKYAYACIEGSGERGRCQDSGDM